MEAIFYPLHRLVRAVLPQMLERKRGKIVVVGSTAGIKGRSGGVALYGAARGAQHAYMRNLAGGRAPCQCQRNGTELCRQLDLLAARLPRDGRIPPAHGRSPGQTPGQRTGAGTGRAVPRRAGERLLLRPDPAFRRRLGRVVHSAL
jgi:hypothetical protein